MVILVSLLKNRSEVPHIRGFMDLDSVCLMSGLYHSFTMIVSEFIHVVASIRVLFLLRWAFLIARLVKNPPACRRRRSNSWIGKIRWRRNRHPLQHSWTSLVAQLVKNPPVMWEIWVRSLGWEDASEKGKATHSSMLA